jgi:hypothetical protein
LPSAPAQWGEVLSHSVEAAILLAGLLLLHAPASAALARTLVTCYFLDLAFMLLPDLLRYLVMAALAAWRWAARAASGAGGGEGTSRGGGAARAVAEAAEAAAGDVGGERAADVGGGGAAAASGGGGGEGAVAGGARAAVRSRPGRLRRTNSDGD